MATLFSIPAYVPDPTSVETVVGYQVQSCTPTAGQPVFTGTWTDIPGSPFTSNKNIIDTTSGASSTATQYRCRPIRQVTVGGSPVTLDTPYSRVFTAQTALWDALFTRIMLPYFRNIVLHDDGVAQTNGTVVTETLGAGNGLIIPDGVKTRFQLQYVFNDDPIKILDYYINVVKIPLNGSQVAMNIDQDYSVDVRRGMITFATPPAATDYLRIDFRKVDFANDDLLLALGSGIDSLSHYGLSGYSTQNQNNLTTIGQSLNKDLMDIICMVAMMNMREGLTEQALRSTYAWRDGGVNVDPFPSRAMEFLVAKLQVSASMIQQRVNGYISGTNNYITRGDFDLTFDLAQMTPFSIGMFDRLCPNYSMVGTGIGGAYFPMWL